MTRNKGDVNAYEDLVRQVGTEQDDVLATLQLVRGDAALEARMFEQLVDLLVEGVFLELRQSYLAGDLEREPYLAELGRFATMCQSAGLLPLSGRIA